MKKNIHLKKHVRNTKKSITFILYVLMLFSYEHIHSQQQPQKYVVRFNHFLLDHDAVNNTEKTSGTLASFLNHRGRKMADSLGTLTGVDFGNLSIQKLFYDLKTTDTVSISRQGAKVYIPPFWATFLVETPQEHHPARFFETVEQSHPLVVYIDPPLKIEWLGMPDDTLYHYQQSLLNTADFAGGINAEAAWNIETGKRHIKVGIFDSGIDSSHQDINVLTGETYYPIGTDSVGTWGKDVVGHGTAVAGIIGARRNNTTGIAGIAGGDGSDTSGVSMLDFKVGGHYTEVVSGFDGNMVSVGIINSARSAGTYYDWYHVLGGNYDSSAHHYPRNMPGYGVHINNHSYSITFDNPRDKGEKDLPGDPPTGWGEIYFPTCHLCMEAYLFSLQNGVVNVIARGNGTNFSSDLPDLYKDNIPQRFDDSWIITVGASGTDGRRLYDWGNQGPVSNAPGEGWYSPLGLNIDLIAPGSLSNVASLRSSDMIPSNSSLYQMFNGTSASAPHVTGVAALMLSYYNKPCYSNHNLDPADVEYILQKSATDISPVGYDDSSGWGRLDALKALQMIEYPKYQIIHPQSAPTQVELVQHDTIHIYLKDPIYANRYGPIGNNYNPLFNIPTLNKIYKVGKRKYRLTYDFSEYLAPPLSSSEAQLLDAWVRHSQTSSLRELQDTLDLIPLVIDTFKIEPDAQIVQLDPVAGTITLEGCYYQFLGYYDHDYGGFSDDFIDVDVWYPTNPNIQTPNMAYSIYISDNLATGIEFPCDSVNLLVDEYASVKIIEQEDLLAVYPNPGKDQLTVKLQSEYFIDHISVIDLSGRIVTEKFIKRNNIVHISTESLETGSYIITVYLDNGKVLIKKWIKL